ncbi:MAG: hypothetical protein IIU70_06325, partial [Anaerotignum sp.]|nr:hypothetical protein [Anaerotignum sp.]
MEPDTPKNCVFWREFSILYAEGNQSLGQAFSKACGVQGQSPCPFYSNQKQNPMQYTSGFLSILFQSDNNVSVRFFTFGECCNESVIL